MARILLLAPPYLDLYGELSQEAEFTQVHSQDRFILSTQIFVSYIIPIIQS